MHHILREFDKGSPAGFDTIIEQLEDQMLDHRKLNKIVSEIGESAPLVAKKHAKLVHALLKANWQPCHVLIVDNWTKTVECLVTSNAVHLQPILKSCIERFTYGHRKIFEKSTRGGEVMRD